ncbi:MAG: hypothetical protein J6R26_04870 [Paludibacteraceae bacterium]|nr:hypothetical protein [Paludibacteraceae bacterium]
MQEIETAEQAMKFLAGVIDCYNPRETAGLYLNLINTYLEDGTIPEPQKGDSELLRYVISMMKSPFIQLMVFTKPAMAIIFRASTMRYVVARLHQLNFQRQCAQSAAREIQHAYQYAPNMYKDGWKALVSKVAEQYEEYGFDKKFMEQLLDEEDNIEPQRWNKLIIDWTTALQRKMKKEESDVIAGTESHMFKAMEFADKEVESYLQSSHVTDMEWFEQSINMMHGIWSRTEYERVQPIVRLQKRYPVIGEIVNRMGRIANEDGTRKIPIATGNSIKLEHSSGSDIEGITSAQSFNGLLPIELAFYSDQQLSDVFWYKYMQGTLQTFRYQSHIAKPTRNLSIKVKAKSKGAMIMCVDTSGSMQGEPMRIAQSLLSRVVWMANRQCRRCYLIYYSQKIKTIDLQLSNWAFDELKSVESGGTDATEMLNEVFRLLKNDEQYMTADILWISDFQVPDVNEELLQQLFEFRQTGTCFYGCQIGDHETLWTKRLNYMYICRK